MAADGNGASDSSGMLNVIIVAQLLAMMVAFVLLGIVAYRSFTEQAVINRAVARAAASIRGAVSGQCSFYQEIATLPVNATTSKFGTQLLENSRESYIRLGCAGRLPAPSAEFLRIAAKYNVRVVF